MKFIVEKTRSGYWSGVVMCGNVEIMRGHHKQCLQVAENLNNLLASIAFNISEAASEHLRRNSASSQDRLIGAIAALKETP